MRSIASRTNPLWLPVLAMALFATRAHAATQVEDDPAARAAVAFERFAGDMRCAVLVALDGKVVYESARGLARPEGDEITPDHLFDLGSVTKHVTAAAVLRLVDKKKLQLDDLISEHLDDLPAGVEGVTVRHVLGHTAGLPRATSLTDEAQADRRRAVREILAGRKRVEPGETHAYSNGGYQLLAALVEEVSGKPFESFVQKELFKPARLKHATLVGGKAPTRRLATLRVKGSVTSAIEAFPSGWGRKGATGALMSVRDFARWDAALRKDKVLKPASREAWATPGPGDYGLGWYVRQAPGEETVLEHGGSVEGYHSHVIRRPASGMLVCAFGDEATDARAIARALEASVLPPRVGKAREASQSTQDLMKSPRIGARPAAMRVRGERWSIDAGRPWKWLAAGEHGLLHAFVGPEPVQSLPAVYLYVDLEGARGWARDLRAASKLLDGAAERRHAITVIAEEAPQDGEKWGTSTGLSAFVDAPEEGAAFVALGLRKDGETEPALTIQLARPDLEEFLAGLEAVL